MTIGRYFTYNYDFFKQMNDQLILNGFSIGGLPFSSISPQTQYNAKIFSVKEEKKVVKQSTTAPMTVKTIVMIDHCRCLS